MKYALIVFMALFFISAVAAEENERLKIRVLEKPENCDIKTKNGDRLKIHYTGKLEDGTKFDSSLDRRQPFEFVLGAGQVISGWEKGLLDACLGEKRELIIPPHMGYGVHGYPPIIPGNSVLVFTTEVIGIN